MMHQDRARTVEPSRTDRWSGLFRRGLVIWFCAVSLSISTLQPSRAGEPGNQDDWYSKSVKETQGKKAKAEDRRDTYARLEAKYNPLATDAARQLKAITWPAPQQDWPQIKDTLTKAETLLEEIEASALPGAPGYPSGPIMGVRSELEAKIKIILASAGKMLETYSDDGMSFFRAFPAEIPTEVFRANAAAWQARLSDLSVAQLVEIDKLYGHTIPKDFEAALRQAHYGATLRSLAGTSSDASLQVVLRAIEQSAAQGFHVQKVSTPRIAVATLDHGRTAGDFPVQFDNDLPFKAVTGGFDQIMADPASRDADVLIILSVSSSALERKVGTYETVQSAYKSGVRSVPNSAYAAAQVMAQQAAVNYQKSAINSSISNAQYCSGIGCIGKLIGQVGAAAAESEARNQLEAATRRLRSTPAMIEEPIYSPYSFKKASISSTKTASVRYDVIDRRAERHSTGSFASRSVGHHTVLYGLKDQDRDRIRHMREAIDEASVIEYESHPVELKVSKILASFTTGGAEAKPFKGLAALRKGVTAKPKRAVVASKTPARETTQQDPRFTSAVVILTPTGRGSGFYVDRDLVLTNLHVVEETKFVEIKRIDGSETFGKVIANDVRLDLALIRVQATGKPVSFFAKKTIPLGETVHAVGHPSGLEFSLTRGIVSGVRELESRRAPADRPVKYVQTDTPINPGNSGGPLFLGKQVVGVNTVKLAATEIEGIGFAVHYDEVRDFLARSATAE